MDQIQLLKDRERCSGCGACMAVCPVSAISMQEDHCGYLYPQIDRGACIACGKCMRICEQSIPAAGQDQQLAFAAVGRKNEWVAGSASGGVFASLAGACIRDGYAIAGAVMQWEDNQAAVYHCLSENVGDISRMQGSKYVQSDAWRCYDQLVEHVKKGKPALFSGTPCQVEAVRKLTGDPENLVTMDLICHGVPALKMLNDYAGILKKRFGGKVHGLNFRDKTCKKSFCARIDMDGIGQRSLFVRSHHFSYYQYFLEGSIYRENCYNCPHACMERVSDITIGDYWGIEQFHEKNFEDGSMPRRNDWSCVLVNTEKGARFLQKYGTALYLFPTQSAWVAGNNRQLQAPVSKPKSREIILDRYRNGGYAAVERAFIVENGGYPRFYWRMGKSMYQNKKAHKRKIEI